MGAEMRTSRRSFVPRAFAIVALGLMASCSTADPAVIDPAPPEWLFVQIAEVARVTSPTTIEVPTDERIFGFTDRPNRLHADLAPRDFIALWDPSIEDGFASDPPNAVVTWRAPEGVSEAELIIERVTFTERDGVIVYDVSVSEGELPPGQLLNVSLFIDGAPLPPSCYSELGDGPDVCGPLIPSGFWGPNYHQLLEEKARLGG